jgi:hypothetical protein
MVDIRDILRSFDRKERAWLVRNAVGSMSPLLAPSFLDLLSERLGLSSPLPADSWWGMDYHLDWLAAALNAFWLTGFQNVMTLWPQENNSGLLTHTIEDIDFIVADTNRVILIEAKAFGDWDRGQLKRKLDRLQKLTDSGIKCDWQCHYRIQIFFVLMSITPPPEDTTGWPLWTLRNGSPVWIEMKTSHKDSVLKTVKCNERGEESGEGTYWRTKIEII